MRPEVPENTPQPLRELIQCCWAEDPAQRPTFPEIITILSEMEEQVLYPGSQAALETQYENPEPNERRTLSYTDISQREPWDEDIGGPVVQSPTDVRRTLDVKRPGAPSTKHM